MSNPVLVKHYHVCVATTLLELEKQVNAMFESGYTPVGGIATIYTVIDGTTFYQGVLKK